jgi:hypothetical protein
MLRDTSCQRQDVRFPPTQTGRNAITDIILKEAL